LPPLATRLAALEIKNCFNVPMESAKLYLENMQERTHLSSHVTQYRLQKDRFQFRRYKTSAAISGVSA